ncbi:hypothetical protein QNN00_17630 [Bacillus velezensis]|nr:hypothetical protein [Bacillus velezensis]
MERDLVYAYSSKHKKTVAVPWADRNDKTKLPDETYHVITPEWDMAEQFAKSLSLVCGLKFKGSTNLILLKTATEKKLN